MDQPPPQLVFLYSDTGGGHRSAAQAILGALENGYPDQFRFEMVDIFREIAPPLLDRVPEIYPPVAARPELLGRIFHLSDDPKRIQNIRKLLWPYIRPAVKRLIDEHPADLFVSVHPLINVPLGYALQKAGSTTPFVTVTTDLVTVHTTYFCPQATLTIVPTNQAYQLGLRAGVAPERMKVVGLPVSEQFAQRSGAPREIRARLGWPLDDPVVLLMGGGEGFGQLEEIASALDDAGLPVTLVVIAGRNQALQQRLEARTWKIPTRVYGFVEAMPDFMHAASILLTKAGPGTICEAAISGLPVILYHRVAGSEEGNVSYLVDAGAGIWAPQADLAVQGVRRWLYHPEERARAAEASLALGCPHAARDIADLIMAQVQGRRV